MKHLAIRISAAFLLIFTLSSLSGFQATGSAQRNRLVDPFAIGWLVTDTNGDGIADFAPGKVVVPAQPSAVENTAAADVAARIGFATTGLTLPIVVTATDDKGDGPRIYIGGSAAPASYRTILQQRFDQLQADEGGVFQLDDNIIVMGKDEAALLAAAEGFAGRTPYIWRVPGEKLSALATAAGAGAHITGLTFSKGKAGINRAMLDSTAAPTISALEAVLNDAKFADVHEIDVTANGATVSAVSNKALPAILPPAGNGTAADAPAAGGGDDAAAAGPARLDLATLYTMRGLFRGTARMPIPSNLDSQLYVPAGEAGVAMANLAARMGLETTGITIPLATPATTATVRDVRTKAVVMEGSATGDEAAKKLREEDTASAQSETALAAGEGELRIVDKAFGRQPAVLVRGDQPGAASALNLLNGHFPNVWETGKQHMNVEEMRYDLHRFFSLRSAAGQASAVLYRLGKWSEEIKATGTPRDVEAKVFVDIADKGLAGMLQTELAKQLGVASVKVQASSMRAGTQCCDRVPNLHYEEPGYNFRQATPTFTEDLTIPWEGTRLLNAVKSALPKLKPGDPVRLVARVSESPEQRLKLKNQIAAMLAGAGAKNSSVVVLSAYKQGFSWLMDEIAPMVKGKAASVRIEFRKNDDPTQTRAMFTPARWVHELYPVDEMLAKELAIPLEKITLEMFEPAPKAPTYRVHVMDAAGKDILTREFSVSTINRPWNGVMKEYETVQIDTGWVRLESGVTAVLDQRIATDTEEFWEHYQNVTLPRVFKSVMATFHGELRPEFAPAFDTLRIDIHMSEPDYELGIDKERISSLEALQEDTFYSTENFINMMGDLMAGRALGHVGRIMPIVHNAEDGKDGKVHIEFYAKPAGIPGVELKWTDASGKKHEKNRELWPVTGAFQPRLIQARVAAGQPGPQSLTWLLPADFKDDKFEEWISVEGHDQVVRTVFPVEQARGQLQWTERMHAAGLYREEVAWPYVKRMGFEFELPVPLNQKSDSAPPREYASFNVQPPATKRPMAADFISTITNRPDLVQWEEPIRPAENIAVLAKMGEKPGVNVYWMGRSYLGLNLWAADVTLPTPSALRSSAKETTLKATIIYSGRQHANEVSSTSHILKLGDQLINDAPTRDMLKQVNVVLHPITNVDGAEFSVQLAELTPNNMLHPGYHGALAADVSVGQTDVDPIYPESRTRKLLTDAWLPDGFLNPHGYPSHEWVQPFSEYSGWVTNRQGANNGRTWWIPRGWFTSLGFLRGENYPYSQKIAYEIQDRIAAAQRNVPGLLDLENRMNARYQRFGQKWQPEDMQQPIVNGIRIYMALKGQEVNPAGGGGRGGNVAPGSGGVGGVSPDVTWDTGYTEAPDETAHGEYMKLMASAGLAFDRVHLEYLAKARLRINRTEREQAGRVTWRVERLRPNLPAGETEPPVPGQPNQ